MTASLGSGCFLGLCGSILVEQHGCKALPERTRFGPRIIALRAVSEMLVSGQLLFRCHGTVLEHIFVSPPSSGFATAPANNSQVA